jgi:hypothetical protein
MRGWSPSVRTGTCITPRIVPNTRVRTVTGTSTTPSRGRAGGPVRTETTVAVSAACR